MNIINALFKDVNKFIADQDQDLEFLVKFIDYTLATVEIDITKEDELQTYLQSVQTVNALYKLLGLTTHMSDKERRAYDNSAIAQLIEEPERILKLKEFKSSLHLDHNAAIVPLFDSYRAGKF